MRNISYITNELLCSSQGLETTFELKAGTANRKEISVEDPAPANAGSRAILPASGASRTAILLLVFPLGIVTNLPDNWTAKGTKVCRHLLMCFLNCARLPLTQL